ncbi:hypothetical protein [Bacillus thuringiensis]|uniref:hypothetical protein n=1 Tax=Bacillus thuringiensis TaxID=1428 RepID=UPI001EE66983|nr:hypothetical protein [Bacillus thuringiensis]
MLSAAKTLAELNPNMTFIYVSGSGTDSTESRRTTVREVSAYFLRKQLLGKDNKKPTPRRRKQKGGFRKK